MYRYEILRDQWLILALFSGVVVVFYFILYVYDYQAPRRIKKKEPDNSNPAGNTQQAATGEKQCGNDDPEYETRYMKPLEAIPWGLKITIVLMVIYAISYSIYAILYPNSW